MFYEASLDECGECGGDNSTCADCAGVPNGDAQMAEYWIENDGDGLGFDGGKMAIV